MKVDSFIASLSHAERDIDKTFCRSIRPFVRIATAQSAKYDTTVLCTIEGQARTAGRRPFDSTGRDTAAQLGHGR